MFIVVDATGDRRLVNDEPTAQLITREVDGPPAFIPVANSTVACWINDEGWTAHLPRNVLGTVMFWYMLGMQAYPVAGSIVITGLRSDETGYEVCSLSGSEVAAFDYSWHDLLCIAGVLNELPKQEMNVASRMQVRQAIASAETVEPPSAFKILEEADIDRILRRLKAGMN